MIIFSRISLKQTNKTKKFIEHNIFFGKLFQKSQPANLRFLTAMWLSEIYKLHNVGSFIICWSFAPGSLRTKMSPIERFTDLGKLNLLMAVRF